MIIVVAELTKRITINNMDNVNLHYRSRRIGSVIMSVVSLVVSLGSLSLVLKLATSSSPLDSGGEMFVFVMILSVLLLFTLAFLFSFIALFFGVTEVNVTADSVEVKRSSRTDRVDINTLRQVQTSVVERQMRYRKTTPLYLITLETEQNKRLRFGVMGPVGKEIFDRFNTLKKHL